jgi:hypothetical protein
VSSKSLIEMAQQLEGKAVAIESAANGDAPVAVCDKIGEHLGSSYVEGAPEPSPYAVWLAEDTRNAQVLEHLLAREDAAGGPGGYGNEFVDSLLKYLRKHDRLTDKQRDAAWKGMQKGAKAQTAPAVETPQQQAVNATMALDLAEVVRLRSALSCLIGETDGTPADFELIHRAEAFIAAATLVAKPAAKPGKVPEGYYAIGAEGDTKFYRVQHGKPGTKWDGFVFVDQQASDDFYAVKAREAKAAVLKAIEDQGVLESLVRYGHELGVCGVCHKTLTDPKSIADGIGPVCKANLGG